MLDRLRLTRRPAGWVALLGFVGTLSGCPGMQRPPPRPKTTSTPAPAAPEPVVRTPQLDPTPSRLAALQAERDALSERARAFQDHAEWSKLLDALCAYEAKVSDLVDSGDEAVLDAAYALLEELAVLRDDLVAREPR